MEESAGMKALLGVFVLLAWCGVAQAEINPDALANAIFKAENSREHPYGVMTRYKHTTPRQACLNTIKRHLKVWKAIKGPKSGFIAYLGQRYAPTRGKHLRPAERRLNKFWRHNVERYYKRGDL